MILLSCLHATRGRPQLALERREQWLRAAADVSRVEYLFSVDLDDDETRAVLDDRGHGYVSGPPRGCNAAFNRAALAARGLVLLVVADDLKAPERWDDLVLARLIDLSRESVLAVSDGNRRDKSLTHPILTRARWERQGRRVFDPAYEATWADADFTECAYRDGVIVESRDLVFDHLHPAYGKGRDDDHYRRQNFSEAAMRGRALFESRFPQSKFLRGDCRGLEA